MSNDLFALVKEEKRKKRMLDIPLYIAGAIILLVVIIFLILQTQPAGNRITFSIIPVTRFAAILIILRFILHYAFSKRINKLQIKASINSSSNDDEERLKYQST